MQLTEEIQKLFNIVRIKIGGGVRQVELSDDVLCGLLDYVIGQYDEKVQSWIIEANWLNMLGKSSSLLQNPQDLAYAFTFQALDFSKDWSQWFSRDVGLLQRGSKFELKKDFINIEKGKQCYLVPAGREIVKVMWLTPSTTKVAMLGTPTPYAGGYGYGGVYGDAFMGMPMGGWGVGNLYDVALAANDIKNRNKFLRGDLVYKVTALETGEHIIHLMSVPGSKNQLWGGTDDSKWPDWMSQCVLWYTYYDVGTNQEDIDACRLQNKSDIIITPDQVPMQGSSYEFMNPQSKATIQQLLVAEAMITVSNVRGYASGKISIPDAELTLDYAHFYNQGKEIKDTVLTDLKERLQRMLPQNIMKNYADMSDSLMNILKQKPLGLYVI